MRAARRPEKDATGSPRDRRKGSAPPRGRDSEGMTPSKPLGKWQRAAPSARNSPQRLEKFHDGDTFLFPDIPSENTPCRLLRAARSPDVADPPASEPGMLAYDNPRL